MVDAVVVKCFHVRAGEGLQLEPEGNVVRARVWELRRRNGAMGECACHPGGSRREL